MMAGGWMVGWSIRSPHGNIAPYWLANFRESSMNSVAREKGETRWLPTEGQRTLQRRLMGFGS